MKSFKIVLCLLIVASMLGGCVGRENLSNLTIVQGVAIDNENDETTVSLQYLNLSKSGGAGDLLQGNITYVADGKSVSISDAVATASKSLSASIFFGQNKIIVFGEDYAKRNIRLGMDYLLRSVNSRPDVLVAMSTGQAKEIIENKERGARIPAQNVYDLLKVGEENGLGAAVSVNDLLNIYSDETSDIYLPVLVSHKDNVSCEGIGVFSNDKYATTLNEFESFGFLFVKNKISGGLITVRSEELGNVGIEIVRSKTKNRAVVRNGKITFCCDVSVVVVIDEVEKGITTVLNEKRASHIEKLVCSKIYNMCLSAMQKCFENRSDPFMIARYVSADDRRLYDSLKNDWRNQLENIEIKITAHAEVEKVNDNSTQG